MAFTNFVPTIWSARLLAHLDNTLVARRFFNRDYEGDVRDVGDKVKINQIGKINVFPYVKNQDMPAPQNLDGLQTEMEIDFARAFNCSIDDIDNVQSKPKLMDSAMQRSAVDLAAAIEAWLLDKLIAGTANENRITNVPIATPRDIYATLVRLRTFLVKSNTPVQGRIAAMPPELVEIALTDELFVKTGGSNAEGRVESGVVARAAGFEIVEINTIPGNNKIVAGHNVAATMAEQITKTEAYRIEKQFGDGLKGLYLAGGQVTRPRNVATASFILSA